MRTTGMTHRNCGGRVEVFTKTIRGFTGQMYICAKCRKTVPHADLEVHPIAPKIWLRG